MSHPVSLCGAAATPKTQAIGVKRVLAIMVQFQPDNDSLTSGNGQFLVSHGIGLDAPPHDKTYFQNHFLFLKNYFEKVSGGKLSLVDSVLDSVVTLPHQMKYYSPQKSGATNVNNLGLLYQDAWHAADSIYKNFDFSQFDCFVIFHAGSGHDVDLTSTLGYDARPYDIPSIYLNIQSLRKMFGPDYGGEAVDNGGFFIPNSIIMPESESYQIYDATGSLIFGLTLGINGLFAANFGSFLGLPDLFDTETGVTGIGRFGLMDGQSFFSYGGIFPPEPSAWEKAYLGWVTPVEVSPSALTTYRLYANATGRYSVLKVPINGSEYFLLENRERDAQHDGESITVLYNGGTKIVKFNDDTTYFDGQQIKDIDGVVTDADEYDWVLPNDTTLIHHGGILIWHIDESVINQNLASNTVNADSSHRGVALMEAHGANEIGRFVLTFLGGSYYDGAWNDFWFSGNPVRTYLIGGNRFTPYTLPNSDSYDGGNSHIYVTDFSSADSVMSVDVKLGDDTVQTTAGFPKNIFGATINSSPAFGHLSADGTLQVIANNGKSLFAFNMDGTSAGFDSTGFFSKVGGAFQPVVPTSSLGSNVLYAMDDSVLYGLVDRDNIEPGTADTLFTSRVPLPTYQAGTPLLSVGTKLILIQAASESWTVFSSDGRYLGNYVPLIVVARPAGVASVLAGTSPVLSKFAAADTSNIYLNISGYVFPFSLSNLNPSSSVSYPVPPRQGVQPIIPIAITYGALSPGKSPFLVELTSQSVVLDTAGGTPVKAFVTLPGDTITGGPFIADLDGDGNRDIIFSTQTKIYAISYTGAVLNHFPISTVASEILPSDASKIVGSVVIADLDDDGKLEVIFGTKGGTLYAFKGATGQLLPGFPLSIAGGLAGSPAVAYDPSGKLYLDAIGLDGYLYSWTFRGTSPDQVVWGNLLHDNSHLNSITTSPQSVQPQPVQSLMPRSEVYNWPNPVTNGSTKIHFYLRDNAQVSIGIFSFAGDKVADIRTSGIGGMANEVDWSATRVQSGVYFARVEAVSAKERDVAIIKIAVVR